MTAVVSKQQILNAMGDLRKKQVVTFEELLRAMMIEQDATRRVLVRKGLLTNEEDLEEIRAVRRGLERKFD